MDPSIIILIIVLIILGIVGAVVGIIVHYLLKKREIEKKVLNVRVKMFNY